MWYTHSYRRNLIDMHIEEWNPEFLCRLDPESYMDALKRARVQTAMLYANSHVGVCYWPTRHGKQHKLLKGQDFLGTMIEKCHNADISVVVYFTLVYDNYCYAEHPQWRNVNEYGKYTREQQESALFLGPRYGTICINHAEYREYVKQQLKELMDRYQFEGFFLDMTFWPVVCQCDACRERYRRETGKEIPETMDWDDPDWLLFQKKREGWMSDFAMEMTDFIKQAQPSLSVEHQYSSAVFSWRRGVTEGNAFASDYAGGDLYGGLSEQSFACKLYRSLSQNQPFEYMTSRCDPGLSCHTRNKSLRRLAQHTCISYAHHGAFLFIDAIDPDGTIHKKPYDWMGEIYEKTIPCEPYFIGKPIREAAIYFSLKGKYDPKNSGHRVTDPENPERFPHLDACLGAAAALKSANILYDVASTKNLGFLADVKLLIVPDLYRLEEEAEDVIIEYVEAGGTLYISGGTASEKMMRLIGLSCERTERKGPVYFAPRRNSLGLYQNGTDPVPLTVTEDMRHTVRLTGDGEILAYLSLPYTDPKDSSVFASIHSNPPGIVTPEPAVVFCRRGKGKIIWSAASAEKSADADSRAFFLETVRALLGKELFLTSDAPFAVEITAYQTEDGILLHLTDQQETEPPLPTGEIHISLLMRGRKATAAVQMPEGKPLAYTQTGERLSLTVPPFAVHTMAVIKTE